MLPESDTLTMKIIPGDVFLNMLASVDSPNAMCTLELLPACNASKSTRY